MLAGVGSSRSNFSLRWESVSVGKNTNRQHTRAPRRTWILSTVAAELCSSSSTFEVCPLHGAADRWLCDKTKHRKTSKKQKTKTKIKKRNLPRRGLVKMITSLCAPAPHKCVRECFFMFFTGLLGVCVSFRAAAISFCQARDWWPTHGRMRNCFGLNVCVCASFGRAWSQKKREVNKPFVSLFARKTHIISALRMTSVDIMDYFLKDIWLILRFL